MLKGCLGLETAHLPHVDRFGLLYLGRGGLGVEDGCLSSMAVAGPALAAGDHQVPHQSVSFILLGPGSTVRHDARGYRHIMALAWRQLGRTASVATLPHR